MNNASDHGFSIDGQLPSTATKTHDVATSLAKRVLECLAAQGLKMSSKSGTRVALDMLRGAAAFRHNEIGRPAKVHDAAWSAIAAMKFLVSVRDARELVRFIVGDGDTPEMFKYGEAVIVDGCPTTVLEIHELCCYVYVNGGSEWRYAGDIEREVLVYPPTCVRYVNGEPKSVDYDCYVEAMDNRKVGDVVTAYAGAPGTGHISHRITRMDTSGVYGVVVENTMRELDPSEVI